MLEMREASFIRGGESRFMIYCAKVEIEPLSVDGGSELGLPIFSSM